jgi:DUF4097 and DUF4098 domain-containing protein YvlB
MCRHATVVLFCFSFLSAAAGPATAEVWTKAWNVTGTVQLTVNADDGDISVDTGDSKEVQARVETVGWHISDDGVRVIATQEGDHINLQVKLPSQRFSISFRRSISIELRVPRSAELDLRTGDGNITTHAVDGSLRADTGDGNINVGAANGDIHLRTGDGNITGEELAGALTADTGDGNIRLEGRFHVADVRTGDGNVEVTALPGSRLASAWKLSTGDGNVVLRLPDGVGADLDAHTGDGSVTLDFPVTISGRSEESRVRGPMNGGGPQLIVSSGDGNIRITKS